MIRLQIVTEGPPKLPNQAVWAEYQRHKLDARLRALEQLMLENERRIEELEGRHGDQP